MKFYCVSLVVCVGQVLVGVHGLIHELVVVSESDACIHLTTAHGVEESGFRLTNYLPGYSGIHYLHSAVLHHDVQGFSSVLGRLLYPGSHSFGLGLILDFNGLHFDLLAMLLLVHPVESHSLFQISDFSMFTEFF